MISSLRFYFEKCLSTQNYTHVRTLLLFVFLKCNCRTADLATYGPSLVWMYKQDRLTVLFFFFRYPLTKLLLCYTPPDKFDPIYKKETIVSAGMVQSIVYDLLYATVFKMDDAMTAADRMIYGVFENGEKP